MSPIRRNLVAAFLLGVAAMASAADVVVLKGGSVIPLKQPWVRRGNTAYLTRADGTLLSVPVSEIDLQATSVASQPKAEPAPAPSDAPDTSTPADAARVKREAPRAKVRITDSDVSHPMDLSTPSEAAPKKETSLASGPAKVEIGQYSQETKGDTVYVSGELRNVAVATAENVKLTVSAIDDKGETIDSQPASLAKGDVDAGENVAFTARLKVGEKVPATLRFAPSWSAPRPPAPTPKEGRTAESKTRRSA